MWLAIPLLATLIAAVVVPAVDRHRRREVPAAERAERMRRALAPRTSQSRNEPLG